MIMEPGESDASTTCYETLFNAKEMDHPDDEEDAGYDSSNSKSGKENCSKYKWDIVWKNVTLMSVLHILTVYGWYLVFFRAKWATNLWTYVLGSCSSLGVTAGAHRLWAHKTYKAKLPFRIILLVFNSMAAQNSVIDWCRDHRVHHKFTETDTDPHNARRGFFFSHIGWLLMRKHEDVKTKGKAVCVQDLRDDPLLAFQHKYYEYTMVLFCFVLPALIPYYAWDEHLGVAFVVCSAMRYILVLHGTWLINSVAHLYGNRPYDKNIFARQNLMTSFLGFGEGWHNYHHTFPMDYRASEFPYWFNTTTIFIEFFALLGLAYDLKKTPQHTIDKRKVRSGEHSAGTGANNHKNEKYIHHLVTLY